MDQPKKPKTRAQWALGQFQAAVKEQSQATGTEIAVEPEAMSVATMIALLKNIDEREKATALRTAYEKLEIAAKAMAEHPSDHGSLDGLRVAMADLEALKSQE